MIRTHTARIWTKPQTQQAIKALRQAGLEVKQPYQGIYKAYHDGKVVFTALRGRSTYAIRMVVNLFEES